MDMRVSKDREARLELYRKQGKIHAKAVKGRFNTLRWAMVWLTQAIFYGACWLDWDSGGITRQAVLADIVHEKFYLFGTVLWPQDALLLAFALILAATGLFFVTALAGRLFCGFACPQTVYTTLFTWIEAKVEGDHLARLKLDQSPLGPAKAARKAVKHGLWLALALWTGITFVGYFTPIRQLLGEIRGLSLGPWEGFWLLFYSAFMYLQAGFAREAVCQHMCPYSRFQGVMFDPDTRTVSYDAARGEPRAARRQGDATRAGDCIDCGVCVQVCPTGIDIRDGLQYQCINCGLCIDACDQVMAKVGSPLGLIRFASERELAQSFQTAKLSPSAMAGVGTGSGAGSGAEAACGGCSQGGQGSQGSQAPAGRVGDPGSLQARPRLLVYGGIFGVVALAGAWTASQRSPVLVDVLRDRGALYRETPEGRIENAYTLKVMNRVEAATDYRFTAHGIPGLEIVGDTVVSAGPGGIHAARLTLAAPADTDLHGSQPVTLEVRSGAGEAPVKVEHTTFVLP